MSTKCMSTYTNLFQLLLAGFGIEVWVITGGDVGLAFMVLRETNEELKVSRQIEIRL